MDAASAPPRAHAVATTQVARINAMRGLWAEHGYAIPVGARTGFRRMGAILADPDTTLPAVLRQTLALVVEAVRVLEAQMVGIDRQLAALAAAHPIATRLQTTCAACSCTGHAPCCDRRTITRSGVLTD